MSQPEKIPPITIDVDASKLVYGDMLGQLAPHIDESPDGRYCFRFTENDLIKFRTRNINGRLTLSVAPSQLLLGLIAALKARERDRTRGASG